MDAAGEIKMIRYQSTAPRGRVSRNDWKSVGWAAALAALTVLSERAIETVRDTEADTTSAVSAIAILALTILVRLLCSNGNRNRYDEYDYSRGEGFDYREDYQSDMNLDGPGSRDGECECKGRGYDCKKDGRDTP